MNSGFYHSDVFKPPLFKNVVWLLLKGGIVLDSELHNQNIVICVVRVEGPIHTVRTVVDLTSSAGGFTVGHHLLQEVKESTVSPSSPLPKRTDCHKTWDWWFDSLPFLRFCWLGWLMMADSCNKHCEWLVNIFMLCGIYNYKIQSHWCAVKHLLSVHFPVSSLDPGCFFFSAGWTSVTPSRQRSGWKSQLVTMNQLDWKKQATGLCLSRMT